jgi:hypothetical protein
MAVRLRREFSFTGPAYSFLPPAKGKILNHLNTKKTFFKDYRHITVVFLLLYYRY